MTWFPNGNLRRIEHYALFEDGSYHGHRDLWNYAVQGGNGKVWDEDRFSQAQRIRDYPTGLSDVHSTSSKRILVLSYRKGAEWITRYYDREGFPPEVEKMLKLLMINPYGEIMSYDLYELATGKPAPRR